MDHLTSSQMASLLKAQQGELDAVEMYRHLAQTVSQDTDRTTFEQLAAEEARHAAVFQSHTHQKLTPKHTKATLIAILYRLIGRKRLYHLIAQGEFKAAEAYAHLIDDFPDVAAIQSDEQKHGNQVLQLLKKPANSI